MSTRSIMLLGTHSNAGKSLLTTGLCRVLARRGVNVAPFKAQNMSNNAGVTPQGGEMGRAQIVQAEAAGIAPHTDMNPVLLKPEANRRSQIVLNGKANGYIEAANWFDIKKMLWGEVQDAYDRLAARHEVIVMEGAGSPAEINLKAGDIVNLRMARHANAPCLLIGDIDRGGVFAALAGTVLLLDPEERSQIRGFIINKFRGDPTLLGNATEMLQKKAFGVPTLGVLPFVPDLQIADEDAVALEDTELGRREVGGRNDVDIVVIKLPHIANFDEFDALKNEPGVRLHYVDSAPDVGQPHAIIVPGSKVTLSDLGWMREREIDQAILAAHEQGTTIVGICGGFQILGEWLADPLDVENVGGDLLTAGLGLLPVETIFDPEKQTNQAKMVLPDNRIVGGYEIHVGDTNYLAGAEPFGYLIERNDKEVTIPDGAILPDRSVWGTYLHGIFENGDFRREWLRSFGWEGSDQSLQALREREYDRFADVLEEHLDWEKINQLIWGFA